MQGEIKSRQGWALGQKSGLWDFELFEEIDRLATILFIIIFFRTPFFAVALWCGFRAGTEQNGSAKIDQLRICVSR
jgi:hypothetical protein